MVWISIEDQNSELYLALNLFDQEFKTKKDISLVQFYMVENHVTRDINIDMQ